MYTLNVAPKNKQLRKNEASKSKNGTEATTYHTIFPKITVTALKKIDLHRNYNEKA